MDALGVMLVAGAADVEGHSGWEYLLERAREVQGAGAGVVCVPDHFDYPEGVTHLESWTALTALAALVPDVRLMPLVLSAPMRPPGLVAAAASTLDQVAPGRVVVGLGAGVDEREHQVVGARFGSAGERVTAVEMTAQSVRDRCEGRVRVVVAGGGPRMIDIAARLGDEWNCGMMEAHRRSELIAILDRSCEHSQRQVTRSAAVIVLGGDPPSGDFADRYNLHLAFRGTSTNQLVEEIGALLESGFDILYLSAISPTGWESTLGALQQLG